MVTWRSKPDGSSVRSSFQSAMAASSAAPLGANGRSPVVMYWIVVSSGPIRARAGAGLDRHVADRHPPFHRERRDRRPVVLQHVPGRAAGPDRADHRQDDVLGLEAGGEPAGHLDAERAGPASLAERLRGQDVLDLARADAEGQGPECAVGAGVAVAADDRQAGERQAQLGTDHVDDPLVAAVDVIERHAKLAAIRPQRLDLPPRQGVANVELVLRRHVVIDRGERQVGPADPPARQPQALERLRTRHLVNQVPVDIKQRRLVGGSHLVALPDFLEQGLGHQRLPQLACQAGNQIWSRCHRKERPTRNQVREPSRIAERGPQGERRPAGLGSSGGGSWRWIARS